MIPVYIALLVALIIMGVCAVICLGLWFEADRLKEQNASLQRAIGNLVRMERLNSKAFYALVQELSEYHPNAGKK